jgi:N-acetylglucosamine-6-phosphate deacetylase
MTFIDASGASARLSEPRCLIGGGTVVLPDGYIENGYLLVENGVITSVSQTPPPNAPSLSFIDAEGAYITPGLVELHIHGCGEHSFDSIDTEGFDAAVRFLASRGVTVFCPTVQSDEEVIRTLGSILSRGGYGAAVPGLYVEGPFVHPEKRGGILPRFLRSADPAYLEHLAGLAKGTLTLLTIAPELPGADELLSVCRRRGIIPCFGHSACNTATALRLARRFLEEEPGEGVAGDQDEGPAQHRPGTLGITHLFNGMSPISHKRSGLAALPFLYREPYVELNGDGIHVNDETLQLCYAHLDRDRLILISDAVVSAGLPAENSRSAGHSYFGKAVRSDEDGVRYAEEGTLVGSNGLLPDVLRHFMRATGAPLHEAVRFASLNPSRFLGIDDRYGSLQPGKTANLILLDAELKVQGVLKSG